MRRPELPRSPRVLARPGVGIPAPEPMLLWLSRTNFAEFADKTGMGRSVEGKLLLGHAPAGR
jgi:hypothetical protein